MNTFQVLCVGASSEVSEIEWQDADLGTQTQVESLWSLSVSSWRERVVEKHLVSLAKTPLPLLPTLSVSSRAGVHWDPSMALIQSESCQWGPPPEVTTVRAHDKWSFYHEAMPMVIIIVYATQLLLSYLHVRNSAASSRASSAKEKPDHSDQGFHYGLYRLAIPWTAFVPRIVT